MMKFIFMEAVAIEEESNFVAIEEESNFVADNIMF